MSEQHYFTATARGLAGRAEDQLADWRPVSKLKVESWLERADFILAERQFNAAAALGLVQEIRNQSGPGFIGLAAGQALGSLEASDTIARNTWPSNVAKQRFELVRNALADQACSS